MPELFPHPTEHPVPPSAAPARPPQWLLLGLAVAINLAWALSYPVSKLVMDGVPVGALTCWRLVGATILLAPFVRRHELPARISAKDALMIGLMGLVGFALPIWLQYMGTVRTTASNISLIVGLETVVVVMLAAWWLKERLSWRAWGGLAAAVAGVALISVDPSTLDLVSGRYWAGNALMLLSVFGFASYTLLGKALSGHWGATALTVVPLAIASAVVTPIVYVADPAGFWRGLALTGPEAAGVLFITAIATAFSYMAWNWLLRWVPAGKLSYSLYLQPVAGALFSAWLLKETLTSMFLAGAAMVVVAMALGAEAPRREPGVPRDEEQPLAVS